MANVWTYWKCPHCNSMIRGDSRECPNCGCPIPSGVKYLMPDNPEVVKAVSEGAVLTKKRKVVTEAVTEVPKKQESHKANWICEYCGSQNGYNAIVCERCGSERGQAKRDYFSNLLNDVEMSSDTHTDALYGVEENNRYNEPDEPQSLWKRITEALSYNWKTIVGSVAAILSLVFLIWLFFPITRTATVEGFEWERSIAVDEYKLCHESDWSVPSGGKITSQREEIHHYDKVLDHYETKTKQVSERVLDHYDTVYRDLGNGQAEAQQKPVYKTVYHTETYQEPVYRKEPVYRTKYYYDIGRWKTVSSINTQGASQEAFWGETDLPTSVSSPSYGDRRQGSRSEAYYVVFSDGEGDMQKKKYGYSEWTDIQKGDVITYKTFRFSEKPL